METGRWYNYDPVKKKLKPEKKIPKGYTPRQLKQLREEEDPGIVT